MNAGKQLFLLLSSALLLDSTRSFSTLQVVHCNRSFLLQQQQQQNSGTVSPWFLKSMPLYSPPRRRVGSALLETADGTAEVPNNDNVVETTPYNAPPPSLPPPFRLSHVPCVIKVIGVGGGGGNAINHMVQQTEYSSIDGVSYWAVNTDSQALSQSLVPTANTINIGRALTRGLGAGGDPTVGQEAAMENALEIKHICQDADLIFITCGMGGGTGSGAAPIVAEIAKNECGCLTVGIVTKPFAFEGRRRMKQAEESIENLRKRVDTLIVVSNDKLLQIVPENTPMTEAFSVADDILRQGVIGISEIILRTGLVNVDFADVRSVAKDAGAALMGIGTGIGKTRATDAALAAIHSPLLECPIQNAKRVVFNICGGSDLGLAEINAASEVIYQHCDPDANIIFGALVDPDMGDKVSITVLACDFAVDSQSPSSSSGTAKQEPTTVVSEEPASSSIPLLVEIPTTTTTPPPPTTTTMSPEEEARLVEPRRLLTNRGFKGPVDPNSRKITPGGLFGTLRGN